MSQAIIKEVEAFAEKFCSNDRVDAKLWSNHVRLVREYALKLAELEKCDAFVVEVAALLHDIGKYYGKEEHAERSYELSKEFLKTLKIPKYKQELILKCIRKHGKKMPDRDDELEVKVVQCADSLGTLFDEEWQETSRKSGPKDKILGRLDWNFNKMSLISARKIGRPQVDKLKKIVMSM